MKNKQRRNLPTKILAYLMTFIMLVTILPTRVFATPTVPTDQTQTEQTKVTVNVEFKDDEGHKIDNPEGLVNKTLTLTIQDESNKMELNLSDKLTGFEKTFPIAKDEITKENVTCTEIEGYDQTIEVQNDPTIQARDTEQQEGETEIPAVTITVSFQKKKVQIPGEVTVNINWYDTDGQTTIDAPQDSIKVYATATTDGATKETFKQVTNGKNITLANPMSDYNEQSFTCEEIEGYDSKVEYTSGQPAARAFDVPATTPTLTITYTKQAVPPKEVSANVTFINQDDTNTWPVDKIQVVAKHGDKEVSNKVDATQAQASITLTLTEDVDDITVVEIDGNGNELKDGSKATFKGKTYEVSITPTDNGYSIVNKEVKKVEPKPDPKPTPVEETRRIYVEKEWVNDSTTTRPENVYVNIYQNGYLYKQVKLYSLFGWKDYIDVPKYDIYDRTYSYTVSESYVPSGYTSTVTGNMYYGFTITNTYNVVEEITLSVSKHWFNDTANDRPSAVYAGIYQNGKNIKTVKLTSSNNWMATVTLPKNDALGYSYLYSVYETNTPKGYTTYVYEAFDHTFIIKNTKIKETVKPTMPENKKPVPNTADM